MDNVLEDLQGLVALISENADFSRLVHNPRINVQDQVAGVSALAQAAGLHALTEKFLGVLATNRRMGALATISTAYQVLVAAMRGETNAIVTSSEDLGADDLKAIQKSIADALGGDVNIEPRVDPSILGGLVVKVGSRMVDSSLHTKLENLKLAMKGV